MKKFYSVAQIPQVPQKYLLCKQSIEKFKPVFDDFKHIGYATYPASDQLEYYLQSYFENPIKCTYQVITQNLAPHVDVCKQENKYNYVYSGNADAVTSWLENNTVIHSVCCEFNTWYQLNVSEMHSVENITEPRLSIVIKEKLG